MKRFDWGFNEMVDDPYGDFVYYDDAAARIAELEAEVARLRESECIGYEALKDNPPEYWLCKVGPTTRDRLALGSDLPMRDAVREAFLEVTGHEPKHTLSGWGYRLTAVEAEALDEGAG